MADVPNFFFLSHARQDRGRYLLQFFEDLEKRLAQWTGINLELDQHLGTIDNRIPHSDDWDENLSRGLSNDNTFIAILSPTYFGRPNCGKELSVFLLRSSKLGIDRNGSLTGVKNVMPLRWYPEATYAADGIKDHLIPDILRLVEDVPAAVAGNPERNRAIEKYRQKGMARCVRRGDYYDELLDAFVEVIRGMEKLPARPVVRFADAFNAFDYDWFKHFKTRRALGSAAVVTREPPTPLTSIVAFYITKRQFSRYPFAVEFADNMIAEPTTGDSLSTDPALAALFADIRKAGVAEGFSVYHVATDPAVPSDPSPLLNYLVRLSQVRIFPIIVVDPWLDDYGPETAERKALNQILSSSDWTGLVISPTLEGKVPRIADLITASEMKTPVLAVPEESGERVAELIRAFFRLRVLSTTTTNGASEGEKPPMLQGPRTVNS